MAERLDPETIKNMAMKLPERIAGELPFGETFSGEVEGARFTLGKIIIPPHVFGDIEIKEEVLLQLGVAEPKAGKDKIIDAFTEVLGKPIQARRVASMYFLTWEVPSSPSSV